MRPFTKHQSGNKRLYSTETLRFLVAQDIFNAIDNTKGTTMVLNDLSKAFDSVRHSRLLKKLKLLRTSQNAPN